MAGEIVLEDGTLVDATPRADSVTLLAHAPDGRLLAALRMKPDEVDDLVAALWSAHRNIVRQALAA